MSVLVRNNATNRNEVLLVDSSSRLAMKDVDVKTAVEAVDTTLSAGINVTDSTNAGKLDTINTTLGTTLNVNDSANGSKLDAIDTTLSGTLTVSEGISRTSSTLTMASVVSALDNTSSVDANGHRKIALYGSSSINTQQIRVFLSDDDTNYYEDVDSTIYANGSNGDYYKVIETVARYIKFQYQSGATETTKYTLMK